MIKALTGNQNPIIILVIFIAMMQWTGSY